MNKIGPIVIATVRGNGEYRPASYQRSTGDRREIRAMSGILGQIASAVGQSIKADGKLQVALDRLSDHGVPGGSCPVCKSAAWWVDGYGTLHCPDCEPPVRLSLVAEVFVVVNETGGDVLRLAGVEGERQAEARNIHAFS